MDRPVQLQFNQAGAWRSALTFDAPPAKEDSDEILIAAGTLARSSPGVRMRIVACQRGGNGAWVSTGTVLMSWTSDRGWEKS